METLVRTSVSLPCLRCGRMLDDSFACSCGATYSADMVESYSRPGFYREWLAALACACGKVDHYADDGVNVTPHRCTSGGVFWMDRD